MSEEFGTEGERKAIGYGKLSNQLGKNIEAEGYKTIDIKTTEQANADWADMGFDKPYKESC